MDAFLGYNQIRMAKENILKTSFINHGAINAFKVLPFGLINAGATYQKMMNKIFKNQISHNMEIYVDDMIVKSKQKIDHLAYLEECFAPLRKNNMKLNPTKCTFGLNAEIFLGHLVSERGIEVNPTQIQAILNMQPPSKTKEVQQIDGQLITLPRFFSWQAD